MMETDYLIVGQGLAGTLLAFFLRKAGQSVIVLDDAYPRAASQVAAGIINPITGRSFVKSWRVDELLPCARQTYRELEVLLDLSFYTDRKVYRALQTKGEENDWLGRTALPEYQAYLSDQSAAEPWMQCLKAPGGAYGVVLQGAQVNAAVLIAAFRQLLLEEGRFCQEVFEMDRLELSSGKVVYKNIMASRIVFCEGYKAKFNPLFAHLPFKGDKGQVLIVRIPGLGLNDLVKQEIFLAPLGEDIYWVGATYEHHFENDLPEESARLRLEAQLEEHLRIPFEVLEHRAAVRPTVKDRRPLLGRHTEFEQVFIFNGLGTKGASLGPFWAQHLTDFLTKDIPLDPAVDIARF